MSLGDPGLNNSNVLQMVGQPSHDDAEYDLLPKCLPLESSDELLLPKTPTSPQRVVSNLQDNLNLGTAFKNLGFASPCPTQRQVSRPVLAGKELPRGSSNFTPYRI